MPAYLVQLPASMVSRTLRDNVDSCVVFAATTADAIAVAKAAMGEDNNAAWTSATVTTIAAPADLLGFLFTVKVTAPNGSVYKNVSYTGIAADTIDLVAAALVTALNVGGGNASYVSATQVLTVTSAGDAKGDHSVEFAAYLPVASGRDFAIPGFLASQVHNGAAGSATTLTLAADAFVLPALIARTQLKS